MVCVLVFASVLSLSSCGKKYVGEVTFQHWGECFDESLIDEFEKKTNIKVNFSTYDSNETLYSKLKMGGMDADLIVPSDYMIDRLRDEGMLEKLDYSNIPNYVNILTTKEYEGIPFEAKNDYYVPYSWGTVGIIYNTKMVNDVVDSWSILWNEKYEKQILMFDNSRDTFGIALKKLGYSYNTTNEKEIENAFEELKKQKPLVQAYVMDQIFDRLEMSEQAMGVYYAGDYLAMKEENEDLAYCLPKEGTNIFYDGFVIPKGAKNKKEAEMLINFLLEKESAKKNMDMTYYATPNKLLYNELPDEVKNDGVIFPSPEYLKTSTEMYKNLPKEILEKYDQLWAELFQ